MTRWRLLNADRVEVTPQDREKAWKELVVDLLLKSPRYSSYRTLINKANFKNFDYKRPLIYEMRDKTILVNSEFLKDSLNRPRILVEPMNVKSFQIVLAFICSILIIIVIALGFDAIDSDEVATI
ncbi:pif-6 [Erannis ankeraria nucleopolyhedrovirus]|uniref:pif-6 n=1 Tax=Erannis ankeraria nucleopolyhedrovirus TaxID=2913600 RepID=UPI00117BCAD0|nr:pif-6 [Erannis ankeraria nucleopolyhedrovirus]UJZ89031.1 pif-6 [Erannis ankeraria nucleopolyhedrovirus]